MITIISFGYRHGDPPEADLTVDVRSSLRNPHADPEMRQKTGRDLEVQDHVLNTPGAQELIELTARQTYEEAARTVAIGCSGGRHRSVVLADQIAALLFDGGWQVKVTHRDIDKPVLA